MTSKHSSNLALRRPAEQYEFASSPRTQTGGEGGGEDGGEGGDEDGGAVGDQGGNGGSGEYETAAEAGDSDSFLCAFTYAAHSAYSACFQRIPSGVFTPHPRQLPIARRLEVEELSPLTLIQQHVCGVGGSVAPHHPAQRLHDHCIAPPLDIDHHKPLPALRGGVEVVDDILLVARLGHDQVCDFIVRDRALVAVERLRGAACSLLIGPHVVVAGEEPRLQPPRVEHEARVGECGVEPLIISVVAVVCKLIVVAPEGALLIVLCAIATPHPLLVPCVVVAPTVARAESKLPVND
eukprot:scaffold66629_cov70-Phaeocystis_antarctica.AAC.6